MRLIIATLTVLSLCFSTRVAGQAVDRSLIPEGLAGSTAQERIYVHYNTSLLFPGEYFLYSVYNLKDRSGEASNFSKIAYVEMIGDEGETIFQQKVKLENGRGSADFFLPTSTPSGNYKIIAYTKWMKNLKNAFFEGDVVVINPYQSNQKKILQTAQDTVVSSVKDPEVGRKAVENNLLQIGLNKNSFSNRERVQIQFWGKGADVLKGRYSLSVRKTGDLPVPQKVRPKDMITGANNKEISSEKVFLPELRGQLVSGKIFSDDGTTPVENLKVALSIPSSEGFVQISLTNKAGQFFFNLDRDLRDKDAILEIIDQPGSDLQILLDTNEGMNLENLDFPEYSITANMQEEILERSLHNQIENAYFSVKPDTLSPVKEEVVFPANLVETYRLDEYTRFKTVPDTFLEIIKSAWVKREGEGREFEVRGLLGHLPMRLKPLVMVDGILLQDHNDLVYYDAGKIETIKIVRDKIYLGPEIFQGAILVQTIDGDFPEFYTAPAAEKVELVHPEVSKRYFQQVYSEDNKDSRIPDYRSQLLWKPSLKLTGDNNKVEFFTSDVDGRFEVVLEGFTERGQPVFVKSYFTVN